MLAMRMRRYYLGDNSYRHFHRRQLIRRLTILALIISAGVIGITSAILPRDVTTDQSDISHRSQRWRSRTQIRTISDGSASQWLRVETAISGTPTATPSQPVTVTNNDTSIAPNPMIPSQPTSDTTSDTTPVLVPAPTLSAPQQAAVVSPAPAPEIAVATPRVLPRISVPATEPTDLSDPAKKEVAMQLVSSAENSSLDWQKQYGYLEDIDDGRGYTGGIIGFTSGTHDMLELVEYYTKLKPGNGLADYLPALRKVDDSDSHAGLGAGFESAWKKAATDPLFQKAQNDERDRSYFNPAVSQAKADGLQALGQFIYYDALVMHGPGSDSESFGGIRAAALKKAKSPAQGGSEVAYLDAFLDARVAAMKQEAAHEDVSRVETAQRKFLEAGNLQLNTPLSWKVYGDAFQIQ